jgi:molybdopterin-guanine dinucleotide biosynthesis protein A
MADNMACEDILGVLLAGGKSRRMGGGDKCLLQLGGKTILQHAIDRARPQVSNLLLNVNGDTHRFNQYNLDIVSDDIGNYAGPLAGVLTGMSWVIEHHPKCNWIITFPTDTPFFPMDLALKLHEAVADDKAELACAASGDRHHPVFGIWPVNLFLALKTAMIDDGVRKIDDWTSNYNLKVVEFEFTELDPFFNINRPEDLQYAETLVCLDH